jgi:hypothetical protein
MSDESGEFERAVLLAKAGLTPPWWAEPLGFLHGEAWAEEATKQAAHEQHVPPRARRRREREKRRASRLDGRWHHNAKKQAEREARFERVSEEQWGGWCPDFAGPLGPDFTREWEPAVEAALGLWATRN